MEKCRALKILPKVVPSAHVTLANGRFLKQKKLIVPLKLLHLLKLCLDTGLPATFILEQERLYGSWTTRALHVKR